MDQGYAVKEAAEQLGVAVVTVCITLVAIGRILRGRVSSHSQRARWTETSKGDSLTLTNLSRLDRFC